MQVTLITVVNNSETFNEFKQNLSTQKDVSYTLVPIWNLNNSMDSPRAKFNEAGIQASGKYLVYLHPDIRFLDPYALHDIIDRCENVENFGVVGIAGALASGKGKRKIISSIYQGEDKYHFNSLNAAYEQVETVDECLFIIRKDYFDKYHFINRDGWHLYAVEYCLDALLNGKNNFVVESNVWHISSGKSLGPEYIEQLRILIKKYKCYFSQIDTTVKAWPTRGMRSKMYIEYYWIKQKIKKKFK